MATRSLICYKENDKYITTYVHFDGYDNEERLLKDYQDYNLYKELASVGYLSSIESTIEESKEAAANFYECEVFNSLLEVLEYAGKVCAEYVNIREADTLATYKTFSLSQYSVEKALSVKPSIKYFNAW